MHQIAAGQYSGAHTVDIIEVEQIAVELSVVGYGHVL